MAGPPPLPLPPEPGITLAVADRVKEITYTVGNDPFELAGPLPGYQGFLATIGHDENCYYAATDGTAWEVGIGRVIDDSPVQLHRNTVLASSNGGALVDFAAGPKEVFVTMPAQRQVLALAPVLPHSAVPVTANVYAMVYEVAGGGAHAEALGVAADLTADAIWRLRYVLPPLLPMGQPKLRLLVQAHAYQGTARVNPYWARVAPGDNPGAVTLQSAGSEGISWAINEEDIYKEMKVPLTAEPLVGGDLIAMDLVFEASGWTLNAPSGWLASIIWE